MSHTKEQRRASTRQHVTWDWAHDDLDVHWVDGEPWNGPFLRPRGEHRADSFRDRANTKAKS